MHAAQLPLQVSRVFTSSYMCAAASSLCRKQCLRLPVCRVFYVRYLCVCVCVGVGRDGYGEVESGGMTCGNVCGARGAQAKAKAAAMPSAATGKAQTPLQAFAQPLASVATAVARGQLPKAVEAIAQPAPKRVAVAKAKAVEPVQRPQAKRPAVPVAAARLPRQQMQATHVGGMKAAPVAARAGPVDGAHAKAPAQAVATPVTPNVAAEAPVQAVAEPMTKAVAAEKPVMAVAQPVVPIKQVAGAV